MTERMKGTICPISTLRNLLSIAAVLLLATILFVGATGAAEVTNGQITYLDSTQISGTYSGNYYEITQNSIPDTDNDDETITWSNGWYYVSAGTSGNVNEVTINQHVTLSGDVYLVLGNYSSLTIAGGIGHPVDASSHPTGTTGNITIYAQSTGEDMGSMVVTGKASSGMPAITGSAVTINGGEITATAPGGGGAGICGYTITINGGNITTTGTGSGSFGILGNSDYDNSIFGSVTINDGNVIATATEYSAGISTYSLTINGGTVEATGHLAGIASVQFTTGEDGNAFIIADSIKLWDMENETYDQDYPLTDADHSGIIFNDSTTKEGKVYGNPTLDTNVIIPVDYTLMIDNGKTLTINADVVLTNNGKIDGSGSIALNEESIIDTTNGQITDTVKVTGIAITVTPATATVDEGEAVTFTATAGDNYRPSSSLTYAWEKSTDDGNNWEQISGATASTYEITSSAETDAGQYRCYVFATTAETSGESSPVTLTVTVPTPPVLPSDEGEDKGDDDDRSLGSSIWLTETPTPTPTEIVTPTDAVPTDIPTTQPPVEEKEKCVPIWIIIVIVAVVAVLGGILFAVKRRK